MDHGTYDEHQAYCESVSGTEPELLQELFRVTHIKCMHPRMISGRYLGRVLSMVSKLVKPQRILEIGTYTGYSALCLAEGLDDGGELITIDRDDELLCIQKEFFSRSTYSDQINMLTGDAHDLLQNLKGPFQLIFLDADKENYASYFPYLLQISEPGTLILIDNMLWEGKVLNDKYDDPQTQAIRKLTAVIASEHRLEQVLLPIRDGLMVVRVNTLT